MKRRFYDTVQNYFQILKPLKKRALLTLTLNTTAGAFEGVAILMLVPLLQVLSGDMAVKSGGFVQTITNSILGSAADIEQALPRVLVVFILAGFVAALFRLASDASMLKLRGSVEEMVRRKMTQVIFRTKWSHFLTLRLGDLSKSLIIEGFQVNMGTYAFLTFGA